MRGLLYHYSVNPRAIGTLKETSLHAALKAWYAQPGDQLEALVDGYQIDLLRGDLLVEIQTRHFSALKTKLTRLLEDHPVRLVHPIPQEKWIVRIEADGQTRRSRRKSPRRGRPEHLFLELIRIPELVAHPNFAIELLMIREEEIWQDDGAGSWRRKGWSIVDRILLGVVDRLLLAAPADFLTFLPPDLAQPFTNRDLAGALRQPVYLARRMTYCLRAAGVLESTGKQGNANLYRLLD
jgi:hypothetical protein